MPHGGGLGGTLEKFRFFIPDTLEDCIANGTDETFENGLLLPENKTTFNIGIMEIWGCGGDDIIDNALRDQAKDRGERDVNIQRARQVDKASFANSKFDQEFLLAKNFSHKVRMADDPSAEDKESRSAQQI